MQRRWVNLQFRGILLISIIVGQEPIALAAGAGGCCSDIFFLAYLSSFLSPSLGGGPIQTEILSQRAIKSKKQSVIQWMHTKGWAEERTDAHTST